MDLLSTLLTGLSGASSLFLVAAGLTVIFGVTRVVNFSHGSLCMLGAYIGWSILTRLPRDPASFLLGVLLTALAAGVIGVVIEVALLRRIYRAPELFQLLATFGVVLIVQDLVLLAWGPNDLALPRPRWLRSAVEIGDTRFPIYDLALIGAGPLVLGLLWLLFTRTRWGTLVRAATLDREMVAALGVDQRWLFTGVFALGAALAGLGGVLGLPSASANPGIDLAVITDAFVVVVVGGLGSLTGAYLASLLIGLLQAFGIALVPQATLVLVFLVMAAVLAVRPNGLLGRQVADARLAPELVPVLRPAPRPLRLLGAAALLLALAAPLLAGPYVLAVLTEALTLMLFAASLHVMMGPGGMPSFGHAAWFGIGAYAAALLARDLGTPMGLGLLAAPLLAGAAAALFGAFVVRLSGIYLAMLTLAFAQIIWAVAFQSVSWTGGDNGILGVWPGGWAATPAGFYWLALALCLGGTMLLRRVILAPLGYAVRAARDSPLRAEAVGLHTSRLRLAAFTVAGAAAGLSGGVYAYAKGGVFPTYISIPKSVDALLMVLLGGVQTLSGPIVGALAYVGLYDALLRATDYWRLVLGAAIISLVLAFPEGIAGAAQRLWERLLPLPPGEGQGEESSQHDPRHRQRGSVPQPDRHESGNVPLPPQQEAARRFKPQPAAPPPAMTEQPGNPAAPANPILEVDNLSKSFSGVPAVSNVSFTVAAGEMLALIGPNGAGKSTTFNMVGGQLRPGAGAVRLDGRPITGLPPRAIWRLGVGRTFQVTATFASMTLRENVQVALLSAARRTWNPWRPATRRLAPEADALLAQVGLHDQAERGAGVLAYGDLKRLELAIALAGNPRLLLMDEPTAGMAPAERTGLMALTRRLATARGLAVLFTEHDMDVVFGAADRILVLNRGEVIAAGPPAAIRGNARVREVYLGTGSTGRGH